MRRDHLYVLELESDQFDPYVRIENLNGAILQSSGFQGFRACQFDFRPPEDGVYIVQASSFRPALGSFTLTIRDAARAVPKWP